MRDLEALQPQHPLPPPRQVVRRRAAHSTNADDNRVVAWFNHAPPEPAANGYGNVG